MHDDQFTAKGPPIDGSGFPESAFSTLPDDTGFQFGLRANARRCGVMGQTVGGGVAGVYGHGRFSKFGVLGTAFGQAIGVVGASVTNTNDLMALHIPPANVSLDSLGAGSGTGVFGTSGSGFGVHGMSQSSTAVLGNSRTGIGSHGSSDSNTGVHGSSDSGFGVHGSSQSSTAVLGTSRSGIGSHGSSNSNTGVHGTSGSGFGVHGESETSTAVLGTSRTGIGSHGVSELSTGVLGTSRSGFGVHGIGDGGPGGVFESRSNAQLRLVPRDMASPEGLVAGAGGELLATTAAGATGPVFRLWYCTRGGDPESATWDLVAGSRPFPGAPLSEGATGIDVKRIQMRLNMITGTQLNGDGELGAITRDAVIAFQEREGIAQTGIVDADTWERLFALS